jgi:anti-sigma factor RsiW
MADHLSCQEVVELITDYLEQALPDEQATLFEQHINFCDGCQRYLEQMRVTIAAVGRIEEEQIAPEALDRLTTAFRAWKRT